MGKKYSKENKDAVNASIAEAIKKLNSEQIEEPVEEFIEEPEIIEENMYDAECEKMLGKIENIEDAEMQSKHLDNLKKMSEIAKIMSEKRIAHRRAQLEEEKLEMEKVTREEELKLKSEEVKAVKRNGVIGNVVSIVGTVVSFICYGALMNRQNEFEMRGETITSASGRDISRHAFDFGRMFKKS